mgnify:CR=1 FL=1
MQFSLKLLNAERHFNNIYKVCSFKFEKGCGSYLFNGKTYDYQIETYAKQKLLFEKSKNINTCIMSYSAKFASGFYSPFRDALGNLKNLGKTDKKTYQIDFRNQNEAIKESLEDIYEGADIIMVKPAIYYLDIVNILKEKCLIPIAAYQVSGEYSMIKIASEKNIINLEDAVLESLIGIKRSGADMIFSYFAEEVSEWLK